MGGYTFWEMFWRTFSWAEFASQVVATLIGSGIAAFIAFRLFESEQRARLADNAAEESRRLQRLRGEAAAQLLVALRAHLEAPRPSTPTHSLGFALEDALMQLLFDGTPESLDMNYWVQARLRKFEMVAASLPNASWYEYQTIRAMLIGWVRGDEGVLANVRNELDDFREKDGFSPSIDLADG